MALGIDLSPAMDFFRGLAGEATAYDWVWQAGVAVVAVILGWWTARVVCREVKVNPRWKFGEGDFERVAYPLFTYLYMAVGKLLLAGYQSTALLEILSSLLVAWLVIRIAVYILGHVLPHGTSLRRTIRTIASVAWLAVVLHILGLLPDVIDALDSVGLTVGKNKQRVTLWLAMQAIAALVLTITLALWISRVTENRLMAADTIEMSTRLVIGKLVRVAALLLAVLVALPMVGIDVTTLSIFSGALGVGLGFGLQKIASNYVSGFIVLLDRSLRVGDVVTVDNRRGEVKAIEARYTVIKGTDGVESIIPNEKMITESVNHHTYSDPRVSVVLGVWISYESDVERACALLQDAAARQGRVIADPPPLAHVKQLGEHGIELTLTVWISDPQVGEGDLRSDLFRQILASFRAGGIEIPYPRRDVRLIATAETSESASKTIG